MSFLSPWSALIAAAIALPLLILLYFLKLRRQQVRIASTLLWEKSFQDLQVNAPFQRLRWSILLFLQLLLLIAMLLALAEPLLRGDGSGGASRLVLLIDRSASMNARDIDGKARLEAAKAAAKDQVESLSRSSRATQAMVIAFGASPQVVSGFESNRQLLIEAIDSIQPTDEEANLESALQLAGAFTTGQGEEAEPAAQASEVVLISDGGVGSPRESSTFRLRSGVFRFVPVGPAEGPAWQGPPPVNNLGIVAFSARRDYDDPARVQVFARLLNAGPQPIDAVITLSADDQPVTLLRKTIPPAGESGAGEEVIQSPLDLAGGAILSLRHNQGDALPADDVAWLVLPPPQKPRIAIVHPDETPVDMYVQNLVQELDPQKLEVISEGSYAAHDSQQIDSGALWDLLIFDRVAAQRLPGIPSLTIGAAPGGMTIVATRQSGGSHILSWDRQHPLMRHVSLDTIVYAGFGGFDLTASATPLAFGPEGPVIAMIKSRNARHVAVGFELIRSNWPLHLSIAVFMQNVVDYLVGGAGTSGVVYRPGESVTVRVSPSAREVAIEGPVRATLAAQPGSMLTLPALRWAGSYSVIGAAPPQNRVAVSVLSDVESDIRPRSEIDVAGDHAGQAGSPPQSGRPLWHWLIAAALALLVIEWLIYCLQAR